MKFKTDLILKILAVGSLLVILFSIWSAWQFVEMALYGRAFSFLTTLLIQGIGIDILIYGLTAWAFFRRLRWFLFLYIPYSIYMIPGLVSDILNYADHSQLHSPFYFPTICHTLFQTGFLLAVCSTCLLYLLEINNFRKRGNPV